MNKANFTRVPGLDTEEYKGFKNCAGYFLLKETEDSMVLIGPNDIKKVAAVSREIQKQEKADKPIQLDSNVFIEAYFSDLKRSAQ